MHVLFYLTVFLIFYGSVYPFNFHYVPFERDTLLGQLYQQDNIFGLGDLIANIVLFVPYGALGILRHEFHRLPLKKAISLAFYGIIFSAALQLVQIYLPERVLSYSDVIWNMLGLFIGIGVGWAIRKKTNLAPSRLSYWYTPPGLITVAWLSSQLIPFIPTLQFNFIKDNLKHLLELPLSLNEIFFALIAWLTVGYWLTQSHKFTFFALLVAFTVGSKLIILNSDLSINFIIGSLFSILLLYPFKQLIAKNLLTIVLASSLFLLLTIKGLTPFEFTSEPKSFLWLPFSGFLEGSMLVNAQNLCEKTFLFGSIIWLIKTTSSSIKASAVLVCIWVFIIELLQIFISSHTPEITDVLLVLFIAYLLNTAEHFEANLSHYKTESLKQYPEPLPDSHYEYPSSMVLDRQILLNVLIRWLTGVVVLTVSIKLVLGLPQIPYNIREMFLHDGNMITIALFSSALLWIGMSGVISARMAKFGYFQFLTLPASVMLSGLISLILLQFSITEETLSDITGSTNLIWQVNEKMIWGHFGIKLFEMLNNPFLISFIERIVRYLALYSPLIFSLSLFNLLTDQANKQLTRFPLMFVYLLLISLPWLYLCKTIAFTYSSTDNLNELIARPGEYQLGGGGYLYLLLYLISINSVLLSRINFRRVTKAGLIMALTVVAIPAGWYLLNQGLVTEFKKYSTTYSGVDFLLGPDRENLLSKNELFGRWTAVQLGLVFCFSYGASIVSSATKHSRKSSCR
ncbi:VanZ family protein [Methylicorpusculum oleiharenae]|uniref:VanZ family protein n=1 Tax=Methylicorpusculum oleiharenae TaxID=1338687 RepID=UPI00135C4301|nr:VanZ family protein [Methylicorpusculum oleiharenae]MCD2452519.1 VanZ family protein [Methylicorpusculum oleiharenae]